MLSYLYDPSMFIYRWSSNFAKKLRWKGRMATEMPWLLLVYYIVWRVNLSKLSRKLVGTLRKTTTNCRVSFNDLYLVFPTNFRIVFLLDTNTVILREHRAWVTCGLTYNWVAPWLAIEKEMQRLAYFENYLKGPRKSEAAFHVLTATSRSCY